MRSYRKQNQTSEPTQAPQEELIENTADLIETLVPGLSKADYERTRSEALEKAKNTRHAWVMKGRGKLTCTSCPFPHVSYIPMNKTLVGIDDKGNPLLKTLD
jgi:hypothetical protein